MSNCSFVELRPGHFVNISQWNEVITVAGGIRVETNKGTKEYKMSTKERKKFLEMMNTLNPTKKTPVPPSKDAPPRSCIVGTHVAALGDIAGVVFSDEDDDYSSDGIEIGIVYKNLPQYEQMLHRGKYVVTLCLSKEEVEKFNDALMEYRHYYGS